MRIYWIFVGLTLLPTAAWADPARNVLKEVAKCADIAAATDRLKCFDAAVPGAQTALAAPEPAPMQTAETEESGGGVLSWFGFRRPVTKPKDFGLPATPVASAHELTSLTAGVLELAKNGYGRSIFVLDNGQVWKQIDGDTTELGDQRKGETMKVTIELALISGYNLTIEGRNGIVKVRRVK